MKEWWSLSAWCRNAGAGLATQSPRYADFRTSTMTSGVAQQRRYARLIAMTLLALSVTCSAPSDSGRQESPEENGLEQFPPGEGPEIPIFNAGPPWEHCDGSCAIEPRGLHIDNLEKLVSLTPSAKIREHWHSSSTFFVGIKGTLLVTLEDGQELSVQSGSYLYVPAQMTHSAVCGELERCVYFEYSHGPYDEH